MDELVRQKLAREMTHAQPIQSERPLADWLDSLNMAQKIGLLQVPVVSDVAGLLGDIQQYRDEPESRGLLNYSLTGLGLLPFMPNMTVFHGSPHKWLPEEGFSMGRPRLDRIGTGEGAQAYGHGMYFAESPGVAESYAEGLKMPRIWLGEKEVPYPQWSGGMPARDKALRFIADNYLANKAVGKPHTVEASIKAARKRLFESKQFMDAEEMRNIRDALDELEKSNLRVGPSGEMYTLDLPDEKLPSLLDWDKPLSQQPEAVRKAFQKLWPGWEPSADLTGKDLYQGMYGGKISAAERFNEAGIPGLRYLDAGSRGAGNGTSNFVIWDQELLDEMARRMANMANKQ